MLLYQHCWAVSVAEVWIPMHVLSVEVAGLPWGEGVGVWEEVMPRGETELPEEQFCPLTIVSLLI